jgi:chromosome partitioning protein
MNTYAVTNWKGGTGKSTVSVNLSDALAREGINTLLIDLDPQGDASRWFDVYGENNALYEALSGDVRLSDGIEGERPAVIPSSDQMVKAASEVENKATLRNELDGFSYDVVLLDCPPSLNDLTVSALLAADGAIMPVQARVIALNGLGRMLKVLDKIDLPLTGVIANQVDKRARHTGEVLETLEDRFNDTLYDSIIRENIKLSEAPSFKQSIFEYAPGSRGAKDFKQLANEFIEREELQ